MKNIKNKLSNIFKITFLMLAFSILSNNNVLKPRMMNSKSQTVGKININKNNEKTSLIKKNEDTKFSNKTVDSNFESLENEYIVVINEVRRLIDLDGIKNNLSNGALIKETEKILDLIIDYKNFYNILKESKITTEGVKNLESLESFKEKFKTEYNKKLGIANELLDKIRVCFSAILNSDGKDKKSLNDLRKNIEERVNKLKESYQEKDLENFKKSYMNLFKENLEGIKDEIETLIGKYDKFYKKLFEKIKNKDLADKLKKEILGENLCKKYYYRFAFISARLECFLKEIEELKEKEVYPDKKTELKEVGDEIEELFEKMQRYVQFIITLLGKKYEDKSEIFILRKRHGKF